MNPGVNFGAELPHKINLRLNGSATVGFTRGSRCKATQTIQPCRGCGCPRTFTGRPAGSATVPPQATVIGARAPAPPVRAPMTPDRTMAGSRAQIHEAMPVEAMSVNVRDAIMPVVPNLLHRGRYAGLDCGPRLRQGGSGGRQRNGQQSHGNQSGCQRQFSDHGSIPSSDRSYGAQAPSVQYPAH